MSTDMLPAADVSMDSNFFVARSEYNSVYTTSNCVADMFGRRHDNVLRDIHNVINTNPGMDMTKMFVPDTYVSKNNRTCQNYKITFTGFILLTGTYNDPIAQDIKMKFIAAFDSLLQKIRDYSVQAQAQIDALPARGTKEFLALALVDANQIIEDQEKKLAAAQPAIDMVNAISESSGTILVRDYAKILSQGLRKAGFNVTIGQQRLFKWLVHNGYLNKFSQDSDYIPSQKSIDLDVFFIKETVIGSSGQTHIRKTAKITGKGQTYFMKKIIEVYKNGGTINVS